jgi:tRNA (guanine26-N2/guanine27-N2)-dimethyltransferase
MWLGQLMDKEFIRKVYADLASRNFKLGYRELVLLDRCADEAGGPPTFYDFHDLSSRAGVSAPKLLGVLSKFRGMGYFASRTHFSDTGLRTDTPFEELLQVFRSFSVIR